MALVGFSHTSGIYRCVALMGGFLKKFALVMGTFLEILPQLGVKKMAIVLQNDPIFAHYGWDLHKSCTYDGCFFLQFAAEGARVAGGTSIANSRASSPPGFWPTSWLCIVGDPSNFGIIYWADYISNVNSF